MINLALEQFAMHKMVQLENLAIQTQEAEVEMLTLRRHEVVYLLLISCCLLSRNLRQKS